METSKFVLVQIIVFEIDQNGGDLTIVDLYLHYNDVPNNCISQHTAYLSR